MGPYTVADSNTQPLVSWAGALTSTLPDLQGAMPQSTYHACTPIQHLVNSLTLLRFRRWIGLGMLRKGGYLYFTFRASKPIRRLKKSKVKELPRRLVKGLLHTPIAHHPEHSIAFLKVWNHGGFFISQSYKVHGHSFLPF